ncbi:unnamed protein product [Jaminaea pallidilutea]
MFFSYTRAFLVAAALLALSNGAQACDRNKPCIVIQVGIDSVPDNVESKTGDRFYSVYQLHTPQTSSNTATAQCGRAVYSINNGQLEAFPSGIQIQVQDGGNIKVPFRSSGAFDVGEFTRITLRCF